MSFLEESTHFTRFHSKPLFQISSLNNITYYLHFLLHTGVDRDVPPHLFSVILLTFNKHYSFILKKEKKTQEHDLIVIVAFISLNFKEDSHCYYFLAFIILL